MNASRLAVVLPGVLLACNTDHTTVAHLDAMTGGAGAGGANTTNAANGGATNQSGGSFGTSGAQGHQGGLSVAGSTAASGGSATTGGAAAFGGSSPLGGAVNGGVTHIGGFVADGGASVAGAATTAGGTLNVGGRLTAGGVPSAGGTSAAGGTVGAGGKPSTGGVLTVGGATDIGGTSATGGAVAQAGSSGSGSNPTGCSGSYRACGCGCCGGSSTSRNTCFYPSVGDSLTSLITADDAVRSSTNCALVGCSAGINYVCCADLAMDPSDASTYSTAVVVGGYDRIRITKVMPNGQCAVLVLVDSTSMASSAYRMTLPRSFGVERASIRDCAVSAELDNGAGGLGTVTVTSSGSSCVLSVHATVFLTGTNGTVAGLRFDADGLALNVSAPCLGG